MPSRPEIRPFAQTLRRDATLVTANAAEFARVPDLRWQNWAAKA